MPLLYQVWDDELAAAALNFSLSCRLEFNPQRASQVTNFDTVGENFSAAGTTNPNYRMIIERAWFNQRVMYNFTENSCTSNGACSFYTQVNCAIYTVHRHFLGFAVEDKNFIRTNTDFNPGSDFNCILFTVSDLKNCTGQLQELQFTFLVLSAYHLDSFDQSYSRV